ncbi:YEATS domain-containing protein 2 [Apophysomyces ossiformis]|uniref:YEATS domain-containing protein 2 n=1 Tax=Apophysomyces ossiformis TaxID=679940 RepID=A0A8H7EV78_9FUNG|nr:YEATS domain-containing protein 2 [Apophysomyces ossiformis]
MNNYPASRENDPSFRGLSSTIPNSCSHIRLDGATRQKILDIIDHQFDLEIYLKQREIAAIRQEIAKAESALHDLELAVNNELSAATVPGASHYTRRSAAASMNLPSATYFPTVPSPPTISRKKSSKSVHRSNLFGRRNDGVFVRLVCPVCKRDDLANQQGFLNHCRLAHNLEFENYEKCMLMCGTPVDESEVPLDHPIRSRPVTKPVPISAIQKKKARPTIKVFEEDVDLELDQTSRHTMTVHTPDRPSEGSKSLPESSISTPATTVADEEDEGHEKQQEEQAARPTGNVQSKTEQNQTTEAPAIESFAAALSTAEEGGSRFYIKKRVIVGNVSKYIAPEKRDSTLKHFTHKWMIYVVEPPQIHESAPFITGVRYHLHPSYKPHDVVEVKEPPFRLTRLGWGEFPVRIQLHFVDKRRNKSVDVIHHLKLDDTHCGKQMLGSERSIEIELDRNTDFNETSSSKLQVESESATQLIETNTIVSNVMQKVSKQKMTLLQGILKEAVRRLPIIRSGAHSMVLPYSCAVSAKMYFNWSVGRRKALEWHRAHLLRVEVQRRAFETKDDVLRSAAAALSTKDVVIWCREHKYTPSKATVDLDTEENSGYCKFCGCLREVHYRDYGSANADENCPRKPKGRSIRKRTGGLSSMTSVTNLLAQLDAGWDEVKEGDDMDIDVDASTKSCSSANNTLKYANLFERIREYSSSEPLDIANERCIDWIWSTLGQLRLKGVVANDIIQTRDGSLRTTTPGVDLETSIDQRLVVGNLLAQATRTFLKRILNNSMSIWKNEHDIDQCDKMLVPHHVYQALQQTEEFDFLTNQYMGPAEEEGDGNKE